MPEAVEIHVLHEMHESLLVVILQDDPALTTSRSWTLRKFRQGFMVVIERER